MNSLASLTPRKLRQAAKIKERIQSLEQELSRILGGAVAAEKETAPKTRRKRRKKMSAEARARISAAMKKAWAGRKGKKS